MHLSHSCTQTLITLELITFLMMSDRQEQNKSGAFERRHKRVTVSLDEFLLFWLDNKVSERLFHSRSHGLEVALVSLKREHAKKDRHV